MKRVFGELELAILNIIKERGDLTVREVQNALGGKDVYTTIMTVMNRLVEKHELKRKREGRHYVYKVTKDPANMSWNVLERFKQKIFGGKSMSMISYLIENGQDISEDDLVQIEEMISQAKSRKNK